MSLFSAVKIVEVDGCVSVEIDGVPLTSCTGLKIERSVEPRRTTVTFSILTRDLTIELDKAEVEIIEAAPKRYADGFVDATRLIDAGLIVRKDELQK